MMSTPQQMEAAAQARMCSWEKEVQHRQLLAQVPAKPPRWQHWTGVGMVWISTWLTRWAKRMTRVECRQGVSLTS